VYIARFSEQQIKRFSASRARSGEKMTDTEVMNGAATDAFPDLGSKSPEKEKKPKANFKKNDKDAGQGKKPRRRPAEADVDVDTPLVKPALVERPDEAAHNDKITQLRENIDAEEKRVVPVPL
jgi:hypothetical protein